MDFTYKINLKFIKSLDEKLLTKIICYYCKEVVIRGINFVSITNFAGHELDMGYHSLMVDSIRLMIRDPLVYYRIRAA